MLANKLEVFYQRINEVKQILHEAGSYQATIKISISILTLEKFSAKGFKRASRRD